MNLHEYQAKSLFRDYGIPTSDGTVITAPQEAAAAIQKIPAPRHVAKAQVHAGGRGKAGGVKLVDSAAAAEEFARHWLGNSMVTPQTDANGQPVRKILIEPATDIARELYLGAVIDRSSARIVVMASTEGGVEIERVHAETPQKILRQSICPLAGPQPWQARTLAFQLGLQGAQPRQFTHIFMQLVRMFTDCDLALVEVNPLVVTAAGDLHCLDAKINADANALHRQPRLAAMADPSQEDPREADAAKWGLNYVALDGNIGCMVNGAGLAMGTMDIIKLHGGAPANFLDVGGGATRERVAEAFKLILSDAAVRAVLVNIFGGIVRCDMIAEGIQGAVAEVGVQVPVIVRLEGNRAEQGGALLADSDFDIRAASGLADAAAMAVQAAAGAAR